MTEAMTNGTAGVRALLSPRNVAIVGASDRLGGWSLKVWHSLRRGGYAGAVYAVNPRNQTVWEGETCYPNLTSLPVKPDHVIVLVPGEAAIVSLEEAVRVGARSATSGFGEGGEKAGHELGLKLRQVIEAGDIAVSGPNCLGNLAAPARLLTIPDDRITEVLPGPVAVVGQSGGIVMALYRALRSRGIGVGYALTTGNEIGLNTADYIRYLIDDPDTKVIACFIEAIRQPTAFFAACSAARAACKPVVVLKIGGSEASRSAALAHTGSLAGSLDCFDAVAETAGVIRLETLDEVVEAVEYLSHAKAPQSTRVGAMTFSGGMKGLMLEAADRCGVTFPPLSDNTLERLSNIVGVGTSLGNPLDAGFTALSSSEGYFACVEALLDEPNIDVLLLQEELPNVPRSNSKIENLRGIDRIAAAGERKPIAVLSMVSYMLSPTAHAFREECSHLPFLHEVNKAMRAVAAAGRYGQTLAVPAKAAPMMASTPLREDLLNQACPAGDGLSALDEALSKELLQSYGIKPPPERVARSADNAVQAAEKIGFPVVLKLLSAGVLHKSDIGGVVLGLNNAEAVRAAYHRIGDNLRQHRPEIGYDGVIVAKQISGGLELVLGVHRDPEVGLVVVFGAGGVLLELIKDVAFGPVPLSAEQARAMIERTKVAKLLAGFRGQEGYAIDSVVEAIVALGALAYDLGPRIESIDVNPFVAMRDGGYALDGLVVLRDFASASSASF
jgi:acetyltransferase